MLLNGRGAQVSHRELLSSTEMAPQLFHPLTSPLSSLLSLCCISCSRARSQELFLACTHVMSVLLWGDLTQVCLV